MILKIHDLSRGGSGVARDPESGRIVFVPKSAPGDTVRVEILSEEKNFSHGRIIELIEGSPLRVEPRCPVFGKCGGCQWQHLPYELQWKTKVSGAAHALSRTQVALPERGIEEFPADHPWGYRNRVQLRGENGTVGFFAPESRELVPIENCPIARDEINAALPEVRAEAARLARPYKVEVEVLANGKIRQTWNARHAAAGFRQVHDEANEKLRRWVQSNVPRGQIVYDLYGGSGNLSELLAEAAPEVHCVDVGAPKVAPEGTPSHFHFYKSPVLPWIQRFSRGARGTSDSVAIVDPPREGLGKELGEIAAALDLLHVRQLIAIGCDPDSWARDLSRWVKRGWRVDKIACFDFFPQTIHLESAAILRKFQ